MIGHAHLWISWSSGAAYVKVSEGIWTPHVYLRGYTIRGRDRVWPSLRSTLTGLRLHDLKPLL
jgi:hypothetical protein